MQLSKRMRMLASMVSPGNRLADVGTDHGYVPIALALEGRIPSALAMDVKEGPLMRAEAHIREQGLSTYIKTRLSDGLARLLEGEADTVLIAGMGGPLMVRILKGGAHCLDSVQELVLQPQSEIFLVREYLGAHGFRITEENIVLDEGKYYPMMKAVHGAEAPRSRAELYYGAVSLQRSPEILREFLRAEQEKRRRILERLEKNERGASARAEELQEELATAEEELWKLEEQIRGRRKES